MYVLCDHSKAQRKVWYTLSQPKMELKVAHHPQELMVSFCMITLTCAALC